MSLTNPRNDVRIERSREAGLDAARQILHEEGFEAVTHTALAQRSGLNRATVYRHWPHRGAILRDLLAAENPPPPVAHTDDLRQDLVEALSLYRDALRTKDFPSLLATVIDRAEVDPEVLVAKLKVVNEGVTPLRDRLQRAKAEGDLAKDCDPAASVAQLVGPLIYRRLCSGESIPLGFVRTIVDQFLLGFGVRPPAGRRSLGGPDR